MDINTKITGQPVGICLTDIAAIGIRIPFSGATQPAQRKRRQHQNVDLNDSANHGSPPSRMNSYNRANPQRPKSFSILILL
jgi:hypothetical protein